MEQVERGYTDKKDDYARRLKRIEGQVRGVQRMIDEDVYCIDVLTQLTAITKAVQAVSVGLIDEHVRHCLRNAVDRGDDETVEAMVDEATMAIQRLMKS
jgi:DNA-binding FrmR family transcriptional regulator